MMAEKKNAALIESFKEPAPIPYDPELLQAMAESHHREWQKLATLRREVYRRVLPTIWLEKLDAERAGDDEQVKAIELRADREWSAAVDAPAITSWQSLEIVMAEVAAAGYPATDAGLHAWAFAIAQAEGKSSGPNLPEVDLELNQIRYAGKCHNVSSDQALLFSELAKSYPEHIAASDFFGKPSRVKDSLPDALKALVRTSGGYRLDLG